jgi:hypothetical protein
VESHQSGSPYSDGGGDRKRRRSSRDRSSRDEYGSSSRSSRQHQHRDGSYREAGSAARDGHNREREHRDSSGRRRSSRSRSRSNGRDSGRRRSSRRDSELQYQQQHQQQQQQPYEDERTLARRAEQLAAQQRRDQEEVRCVIYSIPPIALVTARSVKHVYVSVTIVAGVRAASLQYACLLNSSSTVSRISSNSRMPLAVATAAALVVAQLNPHTAAATKQGLAVSAVHIPTPHTAYHDSHYRRRSARSDAAWQC